MQPSRRLDDAPSVTEAVRDAYAASVADQKAMVRLPLAKLFRSGPHDTDHLLRRVIEELRGPGFDHTVSRARVFAYAIRAAASEDFRRGRTDVALERERSLHELDPGLHDREACLVDVVSLREHCESARAPYEMVRETREVILAPPPFHGGLSVGEPQRATLPATGVARLKNVIVGGASEALGVSKRRTVHDVAALDAVGRWAPADLLHVRPGAALQDRPRKTPQVLREAIPLMSPCSYNYYHFLVELMPRLSLLEHADVPARVPLLVDACVRAVPQLWDLFGRLAGERPHRLVAPSAYAKVRRAWAPSAVTWMPTDLVPGTEFEPADHRVDPAGLRWMRERLVPAREGKRALRLFLRREGTKHRRVTNEADLVLRAERRGFVAIDPGKLDVDAQLDLFSRAEAVVGACGAALANAIFLPEGAKVLGFMAQPWCYALFATVSRQLGQDILHIAGERRSGSHANEIHEDYAVDPASFEGALDALEL